MLVSDEEAARVRLGARRHGHAVVPERRAPGARRRGVRRRGHLVRLAVLRVAGAVPEVGSRKPTSTTAPTRTSRRASRCARRRRRSSDEMRARLPEPRGADRRTRRATPRPSSSTSSSACTSRCCSSRRRSRCSGSSTRWRCRCTSARTRSACCAPSGMTRRQLRRSVRWESVIIAAIGGTVGLALGLVWAWAFASALESEDLFLFRDPVRPGRAARRGVAGRRRDRRGDPGVACVTPRGVRGHRPGVTAVTPRAGPWRRGCVA